MDNYLALEEMIRNRLRGEAKGLQAVKRADDFQDASQRNQVTPAAYVIYAGDRITQTAGAQAGAGSAQAVHQTWLVMICTSSAQDYTGAVDTAGKVIYSVIKALAGWQPPGFGRPLRRVNAPAPEYLGGFGYFYFGFETQLII